MILLRDALRISVTKLRIRIPRLIVTVVISSLLFAFLMFVVTIVRGALDSIARFNSEGLSNRYLVAATPAGSDYSYANDPILIAKLESAQAELVARKVAEAKRLKLEYDPKAEPKWVESSNDGSGQKYIAASSPEASKIINDFLRAKPSANYDSFRKNALQAGAKETFRLTGEFSMGFSMDSSARYLRALKDGKESYDDDAKIVNPYETKGFASLGVNAIRSVPIDLIKPFAFSNQSLEKDKDGVFPIFTSFSVAEESMGLKPLPTTAKPQEKLDRIKYVRESVAGTKIQVCYRNATSSERLANAMSQKKVDDQNKNDKNYQRPSLVYGLPTSPCGEVPVMRDVRTTEQKQLDSIQAQFEKTFGKVDPSSRIQTFRIAGLLTDTSSAYSGSITDILNIVLSTSVGGGWVVPETVVDDPALADIVVPVGQDSPTSVQFVAELNDAKSQKSFMKEQSCDLAGMAEAFSSPQGVFISSQNGLDPSSECTKQNKPFVFSPFGNNAAAIDQFQKGFDKFVRVSLIVLAAISSLIMMGIIGRIIADSRRETAVFRAIGATRLDMMMVYKLYALMLAMLISVASLVIGWIAAIMFSNHFEPIFTPTALLVFNATDMSKEFVFLGIDPMRILQIVSVVFVAALVGMLPPLLANLRRSPLRDMRDEN